MTREGNFAENIPVLKINTKGIICFYALSSIYIFRN